MLHLLKRHPFAVTAHFDWCLVLTYALPADWLTGLLSPGLKLDRYNGLGFVACALVQTRGLRPATFPESMGRDFFLAGFRVFTRFTRPTDNRTLRGLKILRSLTDNPKMVRAGNLLTHYNYSVAETNIEKTSENLRVKVSSPKLGITLDVDADISEPAQNGDSNSQDMPDQNGLLPEGSVFANAQEARKFQGPMPFTFDYEKETRSIIVVKGSRQAWAPRLVHANVKENTFFDAMGLTPAFPTLSSVFYIQNVSYRWERGQRHKLTARQIALGQHAAGEHATRQTDTTAAFEPGSKPVPETEPEGLVIDDE